jgi:2-polyprenyl-3-methyl-5-hydroxy-6-metoxy-1,4-benzoquinol methylase
MIIHKLIAQHFKQKDDPTFYSFQAEDAVGWIERSGVSLGPKTRALDLGCGHGVFGAALMKKGCHVTFADEGQGLLPEISSAPFHRINIDKDDVAALGEYDLVICSNVLEHLAKPKQFLDSVHRILSPGGKLYLSWTNWLSPWGGHEFSPFHYLGASRGHLVYDKLIKGQRKHTPFENLYPTYIGEVLTMLRQNPELAILRATPRYYTEFSFLVRIPVLREFLTWNCAFLVGRKGAGAGR